MTAGGMSWFEGAAGSEDSGMNGRSVIRLVGLVPGLATDRSIRATLRFRLDPNAFVPDNNCTQVYLQSKDGSSPLKGE
jgi:hypothetical protein